MSPISLLRVRLIIKSIVVMFLSSSHGALASSSLISRSDPSSIPADATGNIDNAEDLYGFGVRMGIYVQALAFLIGFFNVLRLDPKAQFSGVVIAFTILVRWFMRLSNRDISVAELWVGLALLLLVSSSGMWLLFFTLETQRRKWYRKVHDKRQAFAEVTKGQTLNILQALVVFLCTVVANSYFSYWIIATNHVDNYPPANGTQNIIWLGVPVSVSSTWVKVVMITQAALGTAFTAFPAFVYVLAAAFAMISYWFPRQSNMSPLLNTEEELDKRTRLETKRWAWGFGAALFLMCLCLSLSVELTLKAAGLTPEMSLQRPGQLLPLIAGATSCVSSAADTFGGQIPVHREHRRGQSSVFRSFTAQRSSSRDGSGYVELEDTAGKEDRQDTNEGIHATSPTPTPPRHDLQNIDNGPFVNTYSHTTSGNLLQHDNNVVPGTSYSGISRFYTNQGRASTSYSQTYGGGPSYTQDLPAYSGVSPVYSNNSSPYTGGYNPRKWNSRYEPFRRML
ncbi:uncharacterized protein PV09_07523 [Verruconis gallopava]|uniref:Uncharacterized protein n=1 Tax=Verruconis gallopava TaxID=253628 RepID=A0A0D1XFR3_9PEZI|nr:uncharacterized protein PV09_07523 [Verruconis gallopava]KIW01006.1 hypothetical protein PV09_07523 [Verruconis gallopava]